MRRRRRPSDGHDLGDDAGGAGDAVAGGAGHAEAGDPIRQRRERVLQAVLTTTAVAAGLAYVPGVLAAAAAGLTWLVVVDTVAWVAVIALAAWRSLPFGLRAGVYSVLLFALAVALLWWVGPVGGGIAWLLSASVVASVFFGRRGAAVAVAVTVVFSVAFGVLVTGDAPILGDAVPGVPYDLPSWAASAGSVVFLAVLLSVGVAYLLDGLDASVRELRSAKARLEAALAERERLEGELVATAKARALGTLAGGIAHDLNNLLVPILAAGSEARAQAPPDTLQRRQLDLVVGGAEQARSLAERILAFSREHPDGRRALELGPVVDDVAALVRAAAPRGVVVEVRDGAPGATVLAEASELHQVLMNLCANAVRALRETGGTVTVTVDRASGGGGSAVRIRVADDGPGVDPSILDRVFDPYVTTRRDEGGSGLGLPIVRSLVASLGGTVDLATEHGVGTTATVVLPEVQPDAVTPGAETGDAVVSGGAAAEGTERAAASERATADEAAPAPAARVLVVDDAPIVRAATRMVLEGLGHAVVEADGADAALGLVRSDAEGFDVVLTDAAMPGTGGLALSHALRALRPGLGIVIATGFLDAATRQGAEALGIPVVRKPFDRRELAEAVAAARRGGRSGDGSRGPAPSPPP